MSESNTVEYWDKYWTDNKEKKSFFNTLVYLARKYYFAKAFAIFIAKNYDIKGKNICEADLFEKTYGILEFFIRFPRKTDNNIRA